MLPFNQEEPATAKSDPRMRRAERLKTLLRLGGTMESQGMSMHLGEMRMDVRSIGDMNDEAWRNVLDSVRGHCGNRQR